MFKLHCCRSCLIAEGVESVSGGGRRASTEPIEAKGRENVHTYHIPITPTHSPYFMQKYYELHRVEIGVHKALLCRNPVQEMCNALYIHIMYLPVFCDSGCLMRLDLIGGTSVFLSTDFL